jgi:hypothetical protein
MGRRDYFVKPTITPYDTLVVTQENPLSKKPAVFLVSGVVKAGV